MRGDRGVLTCSLGEIWADNAAISGESVVPHSAIAE